MPGPLDALKKATSISADPQADLWSLSRGEEPMSPDSKPVMRAPTWREQLGDLARSAYEGLAHTLPGHVSDALGFTDFQGRANDYADPNAHLKPPDAGMPLMGGPLNFYSRVERAAQGLPEVTNTSAALSKIKNAASSEEIDYRKLGDFLGKPGQPVKKADILQHLEQHPAPQVEAVVRGGPRPPLGHVPDNAGGLVHPDYQPAKFGQYTLPGGENYRETLLTLPTSTESASAAGMRRAGYHPEDIEDAFGGQMPQEAYLGPHWDEQANVLAHVRRNDRYIPRDTPWGPDDLGVGEEVLPGQWKFVKHDVGQRSDAYSGFGQTEAEARQELINTLNRPEGAFNPPQSKGRFLEEVQSDWHQAGKEHGYQSPQDMMDYDNALIALNKSSDTVIDLADELTRKYSIGEGARGPESVYDPDFSPDMELAPDPQAVRKWLRDQYNSDARNEGVFTDMNRIHNAIEENERLYRDYSRFADAQQYNDKVPNAPFKESWPDLALKQQVLDVANQPDLDWIGHTTGQTQIDRYNLAHHLSRIEYDPAEGLVNAWDPHGDRVLRNQQAPTQRALQDLLGMDASERIMQHPVHPDADRWNQMPSYEGMEYGPAQPIYQLQGQDLQIGGEGQKYFYDQALPAKLQKILKPFGGKVEQGQLNIPAPYWDAVDDPGVKPKNVPMWYARLTPEMKDAIKKKGLPLLSILAALQAAQPTEDQR